MAMNLLCRLLPIAVLVAVAAGCLDNSPEPRLGGDALASDAGPEGGGGDATVDTLSPDSEPHIDAALAPLAALREVDEGRFATSLRCATCHKSTATSTAMRDAQQRPVGMYDLWRASAMANAARDPLWRAVVAAEVEAAPALKATIEAKCLRCHTPMAYTEADLNGETPVAMTLLDGDTARSQIGLDGVSCALCHQIQPDGLGTPASYSGGFVVKDQKQIFGPHSTLFGSPMLSESNFDPITSAHVTKAALCGSCHTLFTNTLDDNKQPTGKMFPEQTPYLEWRNSVYNTEVATPDARAQTCQGCHMPATDEDGAAIKTQVATKKDGNDQPTIVVPQREPYRRHIFIGGNTLLPTLLKTFASELNPNADAAAFDALLARVRKQLAEKTATVAITSASLSGDTLDAEITIANKTGHKLPTAYPSRRLVVQLSVQDGSGTQLVVSGRFDARGRLVGRNGRPLSFENAGGPTAAHHDVISNADDVQIYEGVLADTSGKVTYRLLSGASYLKDNRLLPDGWSDTHPDIANIAPAGLAGDSNFAAGGDTVSYKLALPAGTKGPLTVRVRLYYQTLSARYAAELFTSQAREVLSLRRMLLQTGYPRELVAEASRSVP